MMDDPDGARRMLGRLFDEHSVAARIDDFGARRLVGAPAPPLPRRRGQARPHRSSCRCSRTRRRFDIVKAIVALAHNLGMEVIAEGVETQAHLDRLKVLGCEYAQGFFIAGPLDAGAATALLERGTADAMTYAALR